MKSFLKFSVLIFVLILQACATDDDNSDCSATLCAANSTLYFQVVDSETGTPVFDDIAAYTSIEVIRTDNDEEANFEIITQDSQKIITISAPEDADFSIQYGDEEIFSLSVNAQTNTENCCPDTVFSSIEIEGAEFVQDQESQIYIIKKPVRSHYITGESAENYQAFFENSELQIDAIPDSNDLEIDVKTGNKLVFKLLQYEDPIPEVADDETTRIVYFEVDADATEFLINSENFSEYKVVTGLSASIANIKYVEQGEIAGEKINDNEWKISLNTSAVTENGINIKVDQAETIFVKSTYEDVWMPIYYTHLFY